MLPPRRMRPSVLDFPADKALENLRTRRLNGGGSGGSRSAFSAAAVRSKAGAGASAVARSESGPQISHAAAAASGGGGHHYHSSGELWVDDNGDNNNNNNIIRRRQPASPAGPRRRRPVSASAVREGLEERSLKLKAMMAEEATRSGDAEAIRGGDAGPVGAVQRGGSPVAGPEQNQRARRGGPANVSAVRRPRSARAALQRPPPVVADFYHYQSSGNGGGGGDDRDRRRETDYANDRRQQRQEQKQERCSRPALAEAAACSPYAADERRWGAERLENSRTDANGGRGGGRGGGAAGVRGVQHLTREEPRPQGSSRGNETRQAPHEEERAWLRNRCEEGDLLSVCSPYASQG